MADYDAFLKVAGLEGESCDHKHPREIELLSFSFGAMGDITMPGRGALPTPKGMEFQELQVTKYLDRTTPSLLVWSCTNMLLNIVLSVRRIGEEDDFLTVALSDAVVTCCSVSKTPDSPPTDQVSFRYLKIEIAYAEKAPNGSPARTYFGVYDKNSMEGSTGHRTGIVSGEPSTPSREV